MASSILELIFRTSKQGTGGKAAAQELKELKSVVGDVSQNFLGFNAASLTAAGAASALAGAVLAVGNYIKNSIVDYQAYGEAIRGMAAITGTGVEETSRLVQAFDDLGISQEQVATAMRSAASKGFVFTIENVRKLADEYNGLSSQEAKNKLLIDNLGKSGTVLAKAFEAGGDAIAQMAKDQANGMVITEKQLAQLERLRIRQDSLNDSQTALSNTIAQVAIPPILDFTKAIEDLVSGNFKWSEISLLMIPLMASHNKTLREASEAAIGATEGIAGYSGALENAVEPQEKVTAAIIENRPYVYDIKGAFDDYTGAVEAAKEANRTFSENLGSNLQGALESAGVKGAELTDALGEMDRQLGTNLLPTQELKDAQAKLAAEYAKSGDLTTFATGLQKINDQYRPMAQPIIDARVAVQEYQGALEKATAHQWDIIVNVVSTYGSSMPSVAPDLTPNPTATITGYGGRTGTSRQGGEAQANGTSGWVTIPPGYPGDSYPVMMSSGESYQVMNDRQRWTGSGGQGVTIQFNAPISISNGMDQAGFERMLETTIRRGQRG
jgi:hypothetical protein